MHNIRVMRNMLINSASHPMCTQPSVGGPIYWIRNIVYHAPGGSTRMTAGSPGVFFYNNTVITETTAGSSANVALAQQPDARPEHGAARSSASTPTPTTVRRTTTASVRIPAPSVVVPVELAAVRRPPASGAAGSGAAALQPRRVCRRWPTTRRRRSRISTACSLDYDVFVNVPKLDAKDPKTVQRLYNFRGPRLPAEARLRGDRSRRGAAERHRRLRRQGAGPRRAGSRAAAADLRPAPVT